MALKFVGKYCSATQARELREEKDGYFIYIKCVYVYAGGFFLDELSGGEKSYLKKVVKGIEQGALLEAMWF